jgi:hypothetical protein
MTYNAIKGSLLLLLLPFSLANKKSRRGRKEGRKKSEDAILSNGKKER